jgi:hypothetical protein
VNSRLHAAKATCVGSGAPRRSPSPATGARPDGRRSAAAARGTRRGCDPRHRRREPDDQPVRPGAAALECEGLPSLCAASAHRRAACRHPSESAERRQWRTRRSHAPGCDCARPGKPPPRPSPAGGGSSLARTRRCSLPPRGRVRVGVEDLGSRTRGGRSEWECVVAVRGLPALAASGSTGEPQDCPHRESHPTRRVNSRLHAAKATCGGSGAPRCPATHTRVRADPGRTHGCNAGLLSGGCGGGGPAGQGHPRCRGRPPRRGSGLRGRTSRSRSSAGRGRRRAPPRGRGSSAGVCPAAGG